MGIRFQCPNGHKLHVKAQLAGQRGVCPQCSALVTIPNLLPENQGAAEPPHPQVPASQPSKEAVTSEVPPSTDTGPGEDVPRVEAAPPKAIPKARPVAKPVAPALEESGGDPPSVAQQPPPTPNAPPPPPIPSQTPPPPPQQAMAADWYLRTATGEQLGPGDQQAVIQWASNGQLTPDAYVWRTGWPEWRTVAEAQAELPVMPQLGDTSRSATAEPKASAASRYVMQRKRAAQRQKFIAIVLLVLVVATAITMAIVLRGQSDPSPEKPTDETPAVVAPAEDTPKAPEKEADPPEDPTEGGEEAMQDDPFAG